MKKLFFTFLSIAIVLFANGQALINVTVSSNVFSPQNITINQGDTVVWTNVGGFHNVNGTTTTYPSNPASFGNAVGSGWTYTFVFNTPGFYNFRCDPHFGSGMFGTVSVLAVDNTNDDWITLGANTTTLSNVAIGTTTPATGYRLSVDGGIISDSLQILPSGAWPDYVFNKDYDLWTLEEVEKFIEVNNHLPGVPDAKHVKENGISVGEMSIIMMKKIEELTLHVIEQSKQMTEQARQIKKLQEENIELRNKMNQ